MIEMFNLVEESEANTHFCLCVFELLWSSPWLGVSLYYTAIVRSTSAGQLNPTCRRASCVLVNRHHICIGARIRVRRRMWWYKISSTGPILPNWDTGHNRMQQKVNSVDLVNLAIYRPVRPKAYLDKVRVYISNQNLAIRPYSQSQTVCAEQRLGLWQTVESMTSN